jgi:glutamate/tyrosine decarboxylase-like PLP-dependent enzyme
MHEFPDPREAGQARSWRRSRMAQAAAPAPALRQVLRHLEQRLRAEPDCAHPLYLAHMRKPPHEVARLAYAQVLHRQFNNHAFDGGEATSSMELECVRQLGALFGWPDALGHLCGGGTVANLEALWLARENWREQSGARGGGVPLVVGSTQAHYCHARHARMLGMAWEPVAVDACGRMLPQALRRVLGRGDVACVVATLGTPALGAVDPLAQIAALCAGRGLHLHADASYGGYHALAGNLDADTRRSLDALRDADSIVVDPHKHGLQPYGCACVLLRDRSLGRHYAHQADYAYHDPTRPHLGRIALECSRPGAAAAALWATLRVLPMVRGGAFASGLERSHAAALQLWRALKPDPTWVLLPQPQLDVVAWGVRASGVQQASRGARAVQQRARAAGLHLSLTRLPGAAAVADAGMAWDGPEWLGLRACLMKPEQLDWVPRIVEELGSAARAVAC